jgi:hypothetical protein
MLDSMTETTVKPARKIPLGPGCLLGFRDGTPAPARLTELHARIRLSGPLAAVELRQSFTNPYNQAMEVCYLYPWGETGSLSSFRARIADRQLETRPAESDDLPENRRPTGLAGLFEGEKAAVFSAGLGLLEPGQNLEIELFYAELSDPFCFPLAGSPCGRVQVLLEAPAGYSCNLPVRSQHLPNGDLLLEIEGPFSEDLRLSPPVPEVLRQSSHHFLLQTQPAAPAGDLVVLVDGSDNATPERFARCQQIARHWLAGLGADRQFALVTFDHQVDGFERGTFQTAAHSSAALDWLSRRRPSGRADLAVLLERLLSLPHHRPFSVLLIACGPLGNEPELYARVCSATNPPPFHTEALGTANEAFLRRLEASSRPLRWQDAGLGIQPASLTGRNPWLGRKSGSGTVLLEGRCPASHPCHNPALPMLWASQKVSEMLDELKLVRGPRASQLRQISQALCREYRLMTEISPMTLNGQRLAPLDPSRWTRPSTPSPLPPRVHEPPIARAGLVSPEGDTPAPSGLIAKLSKTKKYEAKRKFSKPALHKTNPTVLAKRLLKKDSQQWKDGLRALYRTRQCEQFSPILRRLQPLIQHSALLAEVYRSGLACYQALASGHSRAPESTGHWVEKFATLFK